MTKYFAVVFARDEASLRGLQKYGFDLFAQTAKKSTAVPDFGYAIDGLLEIAEIEQLIGDGYRVLIEDQEARRSRASEGAMEFNQWMQRMSPMLERQRMKK
jgi:hypothetical protein